MTEGVIRIAMEIVATAVILTGLGVGALNLVHSLAAMVRLLTRLPPEQDSSARTWANLEAQLPSVAILVPAHNEEATIIASVRAMLALEYPRLEVIVVNDGSHDRTCARLVEAFGLTLSGNSLPQPDPALPPLRHAAVRGIWQAGRLRLIDKVNGGKADALNAGIAAATGADCVCVVDADTLPERQALLVAARLFAEEPGEVLAVGGSIRIGNGLAVDNGHITFAAPPQRLLPLLQTVEYLRTFHAARTAMGAFGAVGLISGAFGVFSREALLAVGGYERRTVGEDYELALRLHRLAAVRGLERAVRYAPDAVCWTEAPESLAVLSRQRTRWQRGALETLGRHAGMFLNPRYGAVGFLALPEAVLVDVVAPLTTVLGYVLIPFAVWAGLLSVAWLWAFLCLTGGLGLLLSALALALEDLRFRRFEGLRPFLLLCGAAAIETLGYRQLCDWWRVQGTWQWARRRADWGTMIRRGFAAPEQAPEQTS
jgi:cellulose synthase/poly-beta-1,6-N-acetylglucosamine synthase-like glycosyltransferase